MYVNGVSGNDKNNCASPTTACKTIAHAISLAASGDVIKVAATTYTENLSIGISLRILGAGATTTILDGGGVGRVATMSSTSTHVTLSGVTIRNGASSASGGGIINYGVLRVINSIVTENITSIQCQHNCAVGGGGIYNATGATLTISKSTVSANVAEVTKCPLGHCFSDGGGIYNGGKATISNSTFSENRSGLGGAIATGGTTNISNSTVAGNGNDGSTGGGIYNFTGGSSSLQNSILASNTGGNCSGSMVSNGYNLSDDASCNFANTGDLNNTDPMLGPLQNNGGQTQTMALQSGSPAVDAGNPNGCTDGLGHLLKTDQRGKPRPDKEDTAGCDMGAYERQSD